MRKRKNLGVLPKETPKTFFYKYTLFHLIATIEHTRLYLKKIFYVVCKNFVLHCDYVMSFFFVLNKAWEL